MKSIYIIGDTSMEESRRLFDIPKDVNVILVNSQEDIPLEDRFKSDTSISIIPYKRLIPDLKHTLYENYKKSSWKRDYKYHK